MLDLFPGLSPSLRVYEFVKSQSFTPNFAVFTQVATFFSSHASQAHSKFQKVSSTDSDTNNDKVLKILAAAELEEAEILNKFKDVSSYLGYIIANRKLFSTELIRHAANFFRMHLSKLDVTDVAKVFLLKYLTKDVNEAEPEATTKATTGLTVKQPKKRTASNREASDADSAIESLLNAVATSNAYPELFDHVAELIKQPRFRVMLEIDAVQQVLLKAFTEEVREEPQDDDKDEQMPDVKGKGPAKESTVSVDDLIGIADDTEAIFKLLQTAMKSCTRSMRMSKNGIAVLVKCFPFFDEKQKGSLIEVLSRPSLLMILKRSRSYDDYVAILPALLEHMKAKSEGNIDAEIRIATVLVNGIKNPESRFQQVIDVGSIIENKLVAMRTLLEQAEQNPEAGKTSRRRLSEDDNIHSIISTVERYLSFATRQDIADAVWSKHFETRFQGEIAQNLSATKEAELLLSVMMYSALLANYDGSRSKSLSPEFQAHIKMLQKNLEQALIMMHFILSSRPIFSLLMIPKVLKVGPILATWWNELQTYVVAALMLPIRNTLISRILERQVSFFRRMKLSRASSTLLTEHFVDGNNPVEVTTYTNMLMMLDFAEDKDMLLKWYNYGKVCSANASRSNTWVHLNVIMRIGKSQFVHVLPVFLQDMDTEMSKTNGVSSTTKILMCKGLMRCMKEYPEDMEKLLFPTSTTAASSSTSTSVTPPIILKILRDARIGEVNHAELIATYLSFLSKSTFPTAAYHSIEIQREVVSKINELATKTRYLSRIIPYLPKSMLDGISEITYADYFSYLQKRNTKKGNVHGGPFTEAIASLVVTIPEFMLPKVGEFYVPFIEDASFQQLHSRRLLQAVTSLTSHMVNANPDLFKAKFVEYQTQQHSIKKVQTLSKATSLVATNSVTTIKRYDEDEEDDDDDDSEEETTNLQANSLIVKLKAADKQARDLKKHSFMPSLVRLLIQTFLSRRNTSGTENTKMEAALTISKLRAFVGSENWKKFVFESQDLSYALWHHMLLKLIPLFSSLFPHFVDVTIICSQ